MPPRKSDRTRETTTSAEQVATSQLFLDPRNPRLAGLDLSIGEQEEILKVLWRERAVNELVDSMAMTGYWPHEVLFAAHEEGKLVVVEGSRRLAAAKLLLDPELCKRIGALGVPRLGKKDAGSLASLPVITCSRQDVWQYIGFKHVNGPQDWDSIAKAEYIARVANEFGVSLNDIARTIGDRHDTVKRLYRGLMVLRQAEKAGVFDREDRWNPRFAYSHLWTGLGYSGFQSFLGLAPDKDFGPNPVPKRNLENLRELCLWLYGSKNDKVTPIIHSQNPDLRNLDEVLQSSKGLAALRAGLPLETSIKASRGDARLLREAMVLTEQKLKEARGLVLTGYTGDEEMLNTAMTIRTLAGSICQEMQDTAATCSGAGSQGKRRARR